MASRRKEAERARKRQMQERERKRSHEEEQRLMQQAFNAQGELSESWMEQILDVENIESVLQENTVRKIQAMLNRQWILANLTDAETHDRVYWLEVMKMKILAEHPPEDSAMVGPIRAFFFDDEAEHLRPLTPAERNSIDQIIQGLKNMATRSRGGFEREQMNTNIARAERTSEESGGDEGGLSGLFS